MSFNNWFLGWLLLVTSGRGRFLGASENGLRRVGCHHWASHVPESLTKVASIFFPKHPVIAQMDAFAFFATLLPAFFPLFFLVNLVGQKNVAN